MTDIRDRYRVAELTPLDVEMDLIEGRAMIAAGDARTHRAGGQLRPLEDLQLCHFGDGRPWPCPVHSS